MMQFVALILFSHSAGGDASVRTLQLRKDAGECAYAVNQETFTHGRVDGFPSVQVDQVETDVVSAKLIAIEYGLNYKVLTEKKAKELYVLTQCGTTPPSEAELADVLSRHVNYTVKHFTIPLQVASSSSTVQLGFFNALGLEDRIKYISEFAVAPCWQKAVSCGAKLNATAGSPQMSEVDAHFMDCNWDGTCDNVNGQAKGVHISASQGPAPLHSAEHIKFVAAFFNKEELASRIFSNTLTAYMSAGVAASPKPVVAWFSFVAASQWSPDAQFELSQASYKLKMVVDTGGANVDGAAVKVQMGSKMSVTQAPSGNTYIAKLSSFNGSMNDASAAFFGALHGVDVIIDETYAPAPRTYTFSTFMSTMGLTINSNLKFMSNKKVLRVDGTISENDDLDWYQSRIAHPDWAVEGLARQIHADTSKPYKYFRNIAKGEVPEVLLASSCMAVPSACLLADYPALIKMMNGTLVTSGTTSSLGRCLSLLLSLVIAAM